MRVRHFLPILLTHITAAQFPDHVDLQKVGEIIFNNEKHNVLKPTTHKITDHFIDFMQRRENKNERVFLDDDGFRHFWNGLGGKTDSLRKTDIVHYEVNSNIKDAANADSVNANQPNEDVVNVEITPENLQAANTETNNANDGQNDIIKVAEGVKVRRKPKRPKNSEELDEEEKALRDTKTAGAAANTGKKKARITFFCPFFGVITMTKFID